MVVQAQHGTLSSGGDASGSGGTVTYSVGQVAWKFYTGENGSVIQGVQQPYEISVISRIDDYDISLNYAVYPNPTRGALMLDIDETDFTGLKYQLFSLAGIMCEEKNIETAVTEINLGTYPSGTYLLRVIKAQIQIRLFKIVKN
ncbi:MAG TPA: T9SS type A sorting domain-containing protein [Bacteroidales bacterium]|nr:T9SS type A sorting domain-containing protein [Bacteroidales bacterium]